MTVCAKWPKLSKPPFDLDFFDLDFGCGDIASA